MAITVASPRRPVRGDAERAGHCGTRGCRCTHLATDPLFPEAPACDHGFRPAPPGARSPRGNLLGPGAVVPCPACREALLNAV
jgi:hypothetical protein